MQNAGIAALGLNWRYLACDVHPDDLRAAISGAKAMGFVGLNLTVPTGPVCCARSATANSMSVTSFRMDTLSCVCGKLLRES